MIMRKRWGLVIGAAAYSAWSATVNLAEERSHRAQMHEQIETLIARTDHIAAAVGILSAGAPALPKWIPTLMEMEQIADERIEQKFVRWVGGERPTTQEGERSDDAMVQMDRLGDDDPARGDARSIEREGGSVADAGAAYRRVR